MSAARHRPARAVAFVLAACCGLSICFATAGAQPLPGAPAERIGIVDTHTHPLRNMRRGNAVQTGELLRALDEYGIAVAILMPPPYPPGHPGTYGYRELAPLVARYAGRLAFVAGGESLNGMIQQLVEAVTPALRARFEQEAEAIVRAGAAGFGEITAEHFSSGRGGHPYLSTVADHPLLLLLADIAARHRLPIDLHMEAVPRDMPFPARRGGGANPARLRANIAAFEELLGHNRDARIVWTHAGWDLTAARTTELMAALLRRHANLYMSIKSDGAGARQTAPLDDAGRLRPEWLRMLREFPDRFVIGSDQFFDGGMERLGFARRFVDALPLDLARRIAAENARGLYRLK